MNNITDFSIENKSDEEILFHFGKESFEQEDYDEAFRLFGLSAPTMYSLAPAHPACFDGNSMHKSDSLGSTAGITLV